MQDDLPSSVVANHKYAKANEEFASRLDSIVKEGVAAATSATEPVLGALVLIVGRDSIYPMSLGELDDPEHCSEVVLGYLRSSNFSQAHA